MNSVIIILKLFYAVTRFPCVSTLHLKINTHKIVETLSLCVDLSPNNSMLN